MRCPESNAVCEAFVKTSKRDHARMNPRPEAISGIQRLGGWFEVDNTGHPHSRLSVSTMSQWWVRLQCWRQARSLTNAPASTRRVLDGAAPPGNLRPKASRGTQ